MFDYRLRPWVPASALRAISALTELLVVNVKDNFDQLTYKICTYLRVNFKIF